MVKQLRKKLIPVNGNSQKLDGGAMFGHVPKALWSQWITPDEQNRITLACRALLIQEPDRNILLETGIGAFFDPERRKRFGVVEDRHVLLDNLAQHGLSDADIDVVIISHLHFDHAGGLLAAWQPDSKPALLFPKATFIVGNEAWERASHPHVRDKASFIPQLTELLSASQRLVLINGDHSEILGADYQFMFSNGHTPGLLHTIVKTDDDPVIFASDLIPGSHWVHLPVTMGYDRSPELLIDEKKKMLDYAISQQARLFYTHDQHTVMSQVQRDVKGKFVPVNPIVSG